MNINCKGILLSLFALFSLFLVLGCEGCENEDDPTSQCPDEPSGTFFILPGAIQAGIGCDLQALPVPWTDEDNFTDQASEKNKWYLKIRLEGFCDNIGKTDEFTIVFRGVGENVEPVMNNGQPAFKISNVPINRQYSIQVDFYEVCQTGQCSTCEEPGSPISEEEDYRNFTVGSAAPMNVGNNDAVPVQLMPLLMVDCECP
ncbi:MAG: hypothetical protein AAGG75_24665 [Bacteroidota bacterium]